MIEPLKAGSNLPTSVSKFWNPIIGAANKVNAPGGPVLKTDVKPFAHSSVVDVFSNEKDFDVGDVVVVGGLMNATSFDGNAFPKPLFEIYEAAAGDKDKVFCVVIDKPIHAGEFGRALVSGMAVVKLIQYGGAADSDYAIPDPDVAGCLKTAETGPFRVLWKGEPTMEVIYVYAAVIFGADPGGKRYEYNGPFKVTVSEDLTLSVAAGFLNRNGDFLTVPEIKSITAENGYLCVCSSIVDKTETWTKPTVKFATPAATAYPVAYVVCEKDNAGKTKSVTVTQPLIVAQITQTKDCPVAVAAAESGN